MLHEDRRRAESFGAEAERYDRSRPTYPAELIDEVLGASPHGVSVLDVGCGTGIAAQLMRERGAEVLGIEPDVRMAALARRRSIEVEIGSFETWDSRGRLFDRITAGQSWHWIDPVAGAEKAASLLRYGGKVCVFWNLAEMPVDLTSGIADVYRRLAPDIDDYSTLVGRSPTDSAFFESRYRAPMDGFRACKELKDPTLGRFVWSRTYTRDEWLDQLPTHSDHAAMEAADLNRLLAEIGRVVDGNGGSFEMTYHTWLISATRR